MSRRWESDRVADGGAAPVVLLRNHRLLRGLATHVYAYDHRVNLVNGVAPSFNSTTRATAWTQRGAGFDFRNGGTTLDHNVNALANDQTTRWTYAGIVVPQAISVTNAIVAQASSRGNATRDRMLYVDSSTNVLTGHLHTGSESRYVTGPTVVAGTPYVFALSANGSLLQLWANGLYYSNTTANTGYQHLTTAVLSLGYGGGASATDTGYSTVPLFVRLWGLAWGHGEAQAFTRDPFQIFAGRRSATVYAFTAGAGAQDIAPSLLSNSQTFYSPTVTPGAVNVAPSLLTNSQTFHAPTVTPGAVDVAPDLLANSQTFYDPTVTSVATIAPSLLSNSQTFYAPTITAGAVDIAPDLLANGQTFYAPTVTREGDVVEAPAPTVGGGSAPAKRPRRRHFVIGDRHVIVDDATELEAVVTMLAAQADPAIEPAKVVRKREPVKAAEIAPAAVEMAPLRIDWDALNALMRQSVRLDQPEVVSIIRDIRRRLADDEDDDDAETLLLLS